MPTLLDVGAGHSDLGLGGADWTVTTLDLDPDSGADIIADVRDLSALSDNSYDVIYASHIIEHVYDHEVVPMLEGFRRIASSHVQIRCPDLGAILGPLQDGAAWDSPLYQTPGGWISALDILYGKDSHVAANPLWAHHTGFDARRLRQVLAQAGFSWIWVHHVDNELEALAADQPLGRIT